MPRQAMRKRWNAAGLLILSRRCFERMEDGPPGRTDRLVDCLMSAVAVFGLKSPSLLQLDREVRGWMGGFGVICGGCTRWVGCRALPVLLRAASPQRHGHLPPSAAGRCDRASGLPGRDPAGTGTDRPAGRSGEERLRVPCLEAVSGSVASRASACTNNGIRLVNFAIRLRIRSWALVIRLIFYSVSELPVPVLPFFAATFRSVFGIAAHRTGPDGAVADTGRSRRLCEPWFPGGRMPAEVAGSRWWPPPPQVRA